MHFLHEQGYTFHGDAPIGGLLKAEADALVLGKLIHDEPSHSRESGTQSRKREMASNHREETERMLNRLKN